LLASEKWVKYQPLVSLIAKHRWEWSDATHKPSSDKLSCKTGAYLTLEGICFSPQKPHGASLEEQHETSPHPRREVDPHRPSNSEQILNYLKIIWSHKVFVGYGDCLYSELHELAHARKWDAANPDHTELLENFKDWLGVLFTCVGPFWIKG
jgi:hypothetical protein